MPPVVATWIRPVEAPVGTKTVICVGELTTKLVVATPLKATARTLAKLRPESTTCEPAGPLPGEKLVITGGALMLLSARVTAALGRPSKLVTSTAGAPDCAAVATAKGKMPEL